MKDTQKTQSKKIAEADSKPAQLAKIIYSGLVRLKESKKAQESGRNCPKALDFGQPERVNVTTSKVD